MTNKILVTSYPSPDLDGAACAYAYAEFLNKTGKEAIAATFRTPHREAQFVMNKFNIELPSNAAEIFNAGIRGIVIVDASDYHALAGVMQYEDITEVIDHRKVNEAEKFTNAKVQIELVGSAATLIAEKFYENNVGISTKSAVLLYSAIVSNTINFKNNVTTDRDKKMAQWLLTKLELPEGHIQDMFAHKSEFKKPLKEIIIDDFATLPQFSFGAAQLEILNVDDFVENNLDELKQILKELQQEYSLEKIFLSCIDLEKALNIFVTVDTETEELLSEIFDVKFTNGVAKRTGILMRKETTPKIIEALS